MDVSVVVTLRNEAATLERLLEALAGQIRPAGEIVLVDGGSTDGTLELARAWAARLPTLRVLSAPGSNISAGRNAGIEASRAPLIAVTDGGCVPAPSWLARLCAPLESDPGVGIVSGMVRPEAESHLEACIGRCSLAFEMQVGDVRFLPTARTLAFRRPVWERAGRFPERLDFGEDTAFILTAANRGAGVALARDAVVVWRPRRGYREVVRQFFNYADGAAQAGLSGTLHRRTLLQSGAGIALLGLGAIGRHWAPWALLLALGAAYLGKKARQGCFDVPGWRTPIRVPLVLLAIHAGTVAGCLRGNLARRR